MVDTVFALLSAFDCLVLDFPGPVAVVRRQRWPDVQADGQTDGQAFQKVHSSSLDPISCLAFLAAVIVLVTISTM